MSPPSSRCSPLLLLVTLPWLPGMPFATAGIAQDPPRVVSVAPAAGDCEVDAASTSELVVVFDATVAAREVRLRGLGEAVPELRGELVWRDDRTVAIAVALQPDRRYRLRVELGPVRGGGADASGGGTGAGAGAGDVGAGAGAPRAAIAWSFRTLPRELPDPAGQRVRNERALADLRRSVEAFWPGLDRLAAPSGSDDGRGDSGNDGGSRDGGSDTHAGQPGVAAWGRLCERARPALLAAKTDVSWAARAAALLAHLRDPVAQVRAGGEVFAAGGVPDAAWRRDLVERELRLDPTGDAALVGRTQDGIGYLAVGAFSREFDLEGVAAALAGLRDCKGVIVDARGAVGGDERRAARIAAWFVRGTHVYARHRERLDGALASPVERTVTGNEDEARRLGAPLVVLVGPATQGAGESFVQMLRCAPGCLVMGQPTAGAGGAPQPFGLGNGAVVVLATRVELLADGRVRDGRGVSVDVPVAGDAAATDRDAVLAAALTLLRDERRAGFGR